jgi:WD40 repeat protein
MIRREGWKSGIIPSNTCEVNMFQKKLFSFLLIFGLLSACARAGQAVQPTGTPAAIPTMTPMANPTATPVIVLPSPTASAEVERIVILNPDNEITITSPDGKDAKQYFVEPDVTAAALSPDGKKVAYNSDQQLTHVIYLLDVQSGLSTQISKGVIGGIVDTILWSRNGDALVFSASMGNTGISQIYRMDPNSGEMAPLTHFTSGFQDRTILALGSLSRDGGTIGLSIGVMPEQGGSSSGTIQTQDVKTGQITDVLDEAHSGDIIHIGGSWLTPDGQSIFFEGKQKDHDAIFRIDLDGTHLARVTHDDLPYDVSGPVVFSPDGQSFFAYAADQQAGDPNGVPSLFSMDGNPLRQLSNYAGKVGSWNKVPVLTADTVP